MRGCEKRQPRKPKKSEGIDPGEIERMKVIRLRRRILSGRYRIDIRKVADRLLQREWENLFPSIR